MKPKAGSLRRSIKLLISSQSDQKKEKEDTNYQYEEWQR